MKLAAGFLWYNYFIFLGSGVLGIDIFHKCMFKVLLHLVFRIYISHKVDTQD